MESVVNYKNILICESKRCFGDITIKYDEGWKNVTSQNEKMNHPYNKDRKSKLL